MASPAPATPPTTPPPPDIPSSPNLNPLLLGYLRRFSLWAMTALNTKQQAGQAQNSIMLVAYDAPPGVTPTVWQLQVNQQGNYITTRVPLGGGAP